jgi:dihydroorotase
MVRRARRSEANGDAEGRPSIALVLAGRALVRGRLQPVEIAIDENGRIDSVGRSRDGGPRHDVGDAVILPAATDLHVHFRDPGRDPSVESFATGTVEAALGGVGLVGDMPNTEPPVTDLETLESKEARVEGRAAVDVLLYASPLRPRALAALSRRAGGFKVYMAPTTGMPEVPSAVELGPLLARLERLHLPVHVHAEDPSDFRDPTRTRDLHDWNAARPPEAELSALEPLLAAPPGLRLHVAHVTEATSADRLREQALSFEATPHHLLLSDGSVRGTWGKVNPPLRSEADRAALWERFRSGAIPILASDHAPHPANEKDDDFARSPSGMPGVETMLPLLLAKVRSGGLSLEVLQQAACDRPARWLGQPMGRLAPGHRANLLVVDFRARAPISARQLHAPCGWTAFEGWEGIFPREHYRDGRPIVRDGEYVGVPNGRVVRPEYAP